MPVLMAIVCVFLASYGYNKTKFVLNPITAMFGMWALILPFSCWGFYGTIIPDANVYIIITIGLIGYCVGTILGMKPVNFCFKNFKGFGGKKYKFNYTLIYILGSISLLYYLSQMVIVIKLLISGYDYEYIRLLSISTEENVLRSSAVVTMTKAFIATPMSYLALALFPLELLKKDKKIIALIIYICLMLGYIITTGGRSSLVWFVFRHGVFVAKEKNELEKF